MRSRISPALVVAALALVLAAGGAGYAAGTITSGQIKDGTIQGVDVANRTLPRTKISKGCASGEVAAFGGCIARTSRGPSSLASAVADCSSRNGRLPTTGELAFVRSHSTFAWADGQFNQYEFTSDYTGDSPFTPIAFDRGGNAVTDASGNSFWHHCVTS